MRRIVIVDDDKECSGNLAASLSGRYEVSLINRAEGALELLLEEKPDLLILDVMFPENPTFGFEFARTVRRNRKLKDLPIILLTGINQHFPMDFSEKDIDPNWLPIQKFMEKPVDVAKLLRCLPDLLGENADGKG